MDAFKRVLDESARETNDTLWCRGMIDALIGYRDYQHQQIEREQNYEMMIKGVIAELMEKARAADRSSGIMSHASMVEANTLPGVATVTLRVRYWNGKQATFEKRCE